MNTLKESKFKVYEENQNQDGYFNKLTDEKALFEIYPQMGSVEELDPYLRKLAKWAKMNLNRQTSSIMDLFEGNMRVKNTSENTITYKLYTNEGDIRASLFKKYNEDAETPGIGNSRITLGFDTDWFGPNDIVIFEGFRETPFLIKTHPQPKGDHYVHELVLLDDDDQAWFPLEYLELGTRMIQIGSLIGESTINRGNVHFGEGNTFIQFEVPMSRMGWEMKVTDNAQLKASNVRLKPIDKAIMMQNGMKAPDILINTWDLKFKAACNQQKDLAMLFGRSAGRVTSKFLDGMTEKPLQSGPGFYEFAEQAIVLDWNPESNIINFITSHIPPLWNDKVAPEDRVIDAWTGSLGLMKWQKAAEALDRHGVLQTAEWNYGEADAFFKGRKGVVLNKKQYRAIYIEPFGLIRVNYLPFLDSELIESRRYQGFPITSAEFFIFNYGHGDARGDQSNVYMLKNNRVEQWGYSTGTWTPTGPAFLDVNKGRYRSHSKENAYWMIHECAFGFLIKDTSDMIYIRPAIA